MERTNKPIDASKPTPNPRKKPAWREYFNLLLIFAFGLLGFSYVMNSALPDDLSLNKSIYIDDNLDVTAEPSDQPDFITFPSTPKQKQLIVSGTPKAQRMMTFTIANFDSDVDYHLSLDNGEKLYCDKKTVQYAFPHSGTFHLQLEASFENQTKVIHSEALYIQSSRETITSSLEN